MKFVNPQAKELRLSNESLATRVAIGAAIGGAALTSLVVSIPLIVICAGVITAGATYFVLK